MWVLLRLLIAAAAFALRYFERVSRPKPAGEIDGTPYFQRLRRNKYKRVTSFRIGVALPVPVVFSLHRESKTDRFFKRLGLAKELRTEDATFDERVYVASDDPALHQVLSTRPDARNLIVRALADGFERISGNGATLWLERSANCEPQPAELRLLAKLGAAFARLEPRVLGWRDRFMARAVVIEAVLWSMVAYAVSTWVVLMDQVTWEYFEKIRLWGFGLLSTVVLFGVLFTWIMTWMRGSSLAHRILVEGWILLVLALPILGTQIVSDLNRHVGTPERRVVSLEITGKRVEEHRQNDGYTYHYFIDFAPVAESPVAIPRTLRVREELYDRAAAGRTGELHVATGWLGIPWLEAIAIR